MLEGAEVEIHRDSLYYICNLSVNLKLFQSKNIL